VKIYLKPKAEFRIMFNAYTHDLCCSVAQPTSLWQGVLTNPSADIEGALSYTEKCGFVFLVQM